MARAEQPFWPVVLGRERSEGLGRETAREGRVGGAEERPQIVGGERDRPAHGQSSPSQISAPSKRGARFSVLAS